MQNNIVPVRRIAAAWWLAVITALAGCTGETPPPSPESAAATRTLVPATATPTTSAITPIPTATDLPAPSSFSATTTLAAMLTVPAAAHALIEQTTDDLITWQNANPVDIRLLSLEAFTWHDESWGCADRYDEDTAQARITRGYRITYSAGSRLYAYHTDTRGTFFLCPDRNLLGIEGEAIPTDPIAQAMVDLTTRDAASRFVVPEARIQLVGLIAVTWPDSSVGCPKPGGIYEDLVTPGYRVVYRVNGDAVIYHTSIRDFTRCASEEEILPGMLRQALRTPTPQPTPAE